jgi:ABC-2 type transport system ATP-binding protein
VSTLEIRGVADGPLCALDLSLGPGHHVLLGGPADGASVLVDLVAGLRRPRRGRLHLDGAEPWQSPALRRRLGVLLQVEPAPAATTVATFTEEALLLRGDHRPPSAALARLDIESWADRRMTSLTPGELRAVHLALALSLPDPAALILHEPLTDLAGASRESVILRLRETAGQGACVLSVTASVRDAVALSDSVWTLERGRVTRGAGLPPALGLAPGAPATLSVRVSDPRALVARLASSTEVEGLAWEGSATEVRVRSSDAERASLAVLGAARAAEITILSLTVTPPPLEAVQAATAGLLRGAYERALEVARTASGGTP